MFGFIKQKIIFISHGLKENKSKADLTAKRGESENVMNKQELLKMTGNEEQFELTLEILLNQIKPEFVIMSIKAELSDIEEQLKNAEKENLIVKTNGVLSVNWKKEYEPLNGDTVWKATDEQKNEMNIIREKLHKVDSLIYRRNRVLSLISVK